MIAFLPDGGPSVMVEITMHPRFPAAWETSPHREQEGQGERHSRRSSRSLARPPDRRSPTAEPCNTASVRPD